MNTIRLHLAGSGTALALGLAAGFLPALPAQARTFVPCNDIAALRNAISQADNAGHGVISLAAGCTYTLTDPDTPGGDDGLPPITGKIRIRPDRPHSHAVITRSASATSGFRIFHVTGSGALRLNSITLSNGSAARGGGIYNEGGAVSVNAGAISGDHATFDGGGIFSQGGTLAVNASSISNDQALSAGGGIYSDGGAVTVNASSISHDRASSSGGGIARAGGTLIVNAATISDDQAHSGGGISNGAPGGNGTAILTATLVTGNTAAGGQGGGIYSASGSTLTLVASTVTGNTPDNCFPPGSAQSCGGLVIALRPGR